MKLNGKQLLAIGIAAILVVVLFLPSYKTSKKAASDSIQPEITNESELVTLKSVYVHQADSLSKGRWSELEKAGNDENTFQSLLNISDSLQMFGLSAMVGNDYASKYPAYKTWIYVANRSINALENTNQTIGHSYFLNLGKEASEKSLKIKPNDLLALNYLAQTKMDEGNDVMGAVQLLKKVLTIDSNNVDATRNLGLLSMQSGQWDKALIRFQKLTKLEPLNPENYYHLGEIYESLNDGANATKAYLTCKGLVSDSEFKNTLNDKINTIKNNIKK